jgi:hypothetical protein
VLELCGRSRRLGGCNCDCCFFFGGGGGVVHVLVVIQVFVVTVDVLCAIGRIARGVGRR